MLLLARATSEAGTTSGATVQKALQAIRNFNGASGTFSINEKGAVNKQPVLWRIAGLEYVPVE